MLHIRIDHFGGPEVLTPVTAPDPQAGPGQVLIRTLAAGVTFVDTQIRAGRPPWPGPLPALPLVLGNGVAGVVVAAGDDASQGLLGRTVVTATGGSGGYAELVTVAAGQPFILPSGIEPVTGLAMLADGRTALALVRAANVGPADRVLVLAAGGGVGTLLVQLARANGASVVVAAASTAEKLALARELGAHMTVNYASAGWAAELRRQVRDLTVIFDGVGGALAEQAMGLAGSEARVGAFGGASGHLTTAEAVTARGFQLVRGSTIAASPAANRLLVEQALAAAATGELRVISHQRFPLSQASAAHQAIEARSTVGKTVLRC